MFDCPTSVDFYAKVVYFPVTCDGAVESASVPTGLLRETSRTLWSTDRRIRIFPNSPDQRKAFSHERFPAGLSPAHGCAFMSFMLSLFRENRKTSRQPIWILFSVKDFRRDFPRRFESDTSVSSVTNLGKLSGKKTGKIRKRFLTGFPMETRCLYWKYVRTRQARRKRGEKRKSVSGIKTGKIPGNFLGNPTNIIPLRIPCGARTPRVSRPLPKAGVSATPYLSLVRDETYDRPAWPTHAPAEIPAEFFHAREGVLLCIFFTSFAPLTHLLTPFITSVTPLSHPESPDRIFRIRRETLWFTEPFLQTCTRMSRLFLRKSSAGSFPLASRTESLRVRIFRRNGTAGSGCRLSEVPARLRPARSHARSRSG